MKRAAAREWRNALRSVAQNREGFRYGPSSRGLSPLSLSVTPSCRHPLGLAPCRTGHDSPWWPASSSTLAQSEASTPAPPMTGRPSLSHRQARGSFAQAGARTARGEGSKAAPRSLTSNMCDPWVHGGDSFREPKRLPPRCNQPRRTKQKLRPGICLGSRPMSAFRTLNPLVVPPGRACLGLHRRR